MPFMRPSLSCFRGWLLAGVALFFVFPALGQESEPPAPPVVFQKPIPRDQLAFLSGFAGEPSGKLYHDKQFRKLMKSFVPDCMFHYGRDMPLPQALDTVLDGSSAPVQVRDGRYVSARWPGDAHTFARRFAEVLSG